MGHGPAAQFVGFLFDLFNPPRLRRVHAPKVILQHLQPLAGLVGLLCELLQKIGRTRPKWIGESHFLFPSRKLEFSSS